MTDAPNTRVVVIDDSQTVLRVVDDVLSRQGYETWCTDSGADAVSLVRQVRPDLIFVDFAMPTVNGFEVCRQLGEHSDTDAIPIVIMSTRGDPVSARFVREMGIVDHISKPFAPEALLALVEHVLHRSRAPRRETTRDDPQRREQRAQREVAEVLQTPLSETWLPDEHVLRLSRAVQKLRAAPALSGDLAQCGLAEVFQMLGLQRQTGRLGVRSDDTEIEAWYRGGSIRLVTGIGIAEEHRLGAILVRRGSMNSTELSSLIESHPDEHRRLGARAIAAGFVEPKQLSDAMRLQSSELVYELLRFGEGSFDFVCFSELPGWVLEFGFELTVDELLMEGFRRVDEWGLIEAAIPSFDQVPAVRLHLTTALTDAERTVLNAIDGRLNVRQVLDVASLGTFDGARLLYRLVSSGVVKLLPPI
ncbi:MAG: response regulator [Myxococcota bacterium]